LLESKTIQGKSKTIKTEVKNGALLSAATIGLYISILDGATIAGRSQFRGVQDNTI
jgi:hypothetical protein